MATFISLMKLTEQGWKNIKDAPKRIEQNEKATVARGGKFTIYSTMGEYDYVTILEVPDENVNDLSFLSSMLAYGSTYVCTSNTLRAFTKEEFVNAVNKIP